MEITHSKTQCVVPAREIKLPEKTQGRRLQTAKIRNTIKAWQGSELI